MLTEDEALVKKAITYCKHLPIYTYYEQLSSTNKNDNIKLRKQKVSESTTSMDIRYTSLCNYNHIIYNLFLYEKFRIVVTRWRLSCFKLNIECGRYQNIPRNERLCIKCPLKVIEDENHVLFDCSYYNTIRMIHNYILTQYTSVKDILNPKSFDDRTKIAKYLIDIENEREK